MSKSAALLFALILGAGACATTEPPQTIVAVVPAQERDATAPETDSSAPESTDASNELQPDTTLASESSSTSQAPTTTETPVETTTTQSPLTTEGTSLADLVSGSMAPDGQHMSARFTGGMSFAGTVEGEHIDLDMAIDGAFDTKTESMEMSIDMSSIGEMIAAEAGDSQDYAMFSNMFAEPMRMRSIGSTAWMKWGLLDMLTGDPGKWVEMELDEADFAGTAGGPNDIMEMLSNATGDVSNLGSEQIAGVDTTHYALSIDLQNSVAQLPAAEAQELMAIVGDFGELPLDIWVDSNGLLRRLEMSISTEAFGALMGPSDNFSATIWYEISQYGSEVNIAAPPADQVISGANLGMF